MSRLAKFSDELILRAAALVQSAQNIEQLRAAQAVLLPSLHGLSMEETAVALGVSRATLGRLQQSSRSTKPKATANTWGGRRHFHMTLEEERAFLQPWAEQAKDAGLLIIAPIRAALAQKLGRPVKASVVWRLLARHGWRKVAPDMRHPKNDPVAQEDWKKNSRRWWPPSSSRPKPQGAKSA